MTRARRWIAGIVVLGLLVAVPVALAVDAFGPVETSDPELRIGAIMPDSPQLAAGGNGDAVWGSGANVPGGLQMAVYERCGVSPVTWRRTLLGTADSDLRPWGVAMNSAGVALAVWRVPGAGNDVTFLSSVRPPGGTWGEPQKIVTAEVGALEFAIGGNGDALAAWNQSNPTEARAAVRPADGDWTDKKTLVAANQSVRVAMSEAGAAVVLSYSATAVQEEAYYRPAGGSWGGAEKLLTTNSSPGINQFVEFDGDGRPFAVFGNQGLPGVLRVSTRSAGQWTANPDVLDQGPLLGITRLARLPHGVVALWGRSTGVGQLAVKRLGIDANPHIYLPGANRFSRVSVGADGAGRVLLAATVDSGPAQQIDGAIVSPGDDWPDALARLSPSPGAPGPLYRDPLAAGGGSTLFLGWGVHGTNDPHSEAIATAPPPLNCDGTPVTTATATATATATVQPQPQPLPQPQPKPQPKLPKAVGGFVALPKAGHCIRTSKLTFRVLRPKGFTVKQIVVKLNGRRAKLVKGHALLHAIALRHLPRRSFTVAVDVKLSDGRTLHGKRHYKRCA